LFTLQVFAAGDVTEVLPLHYISATDAQTALKPLLGAGATITEMNNSLIVNASSDDMSKIKSILKQIDIAPVMFGITLHQGDENWLDAEANDDITYNSDSPTAADYTQSVNVLSGASAFINSSTNVPVISSVGVGLWTGVGYDRMQANQGFLIQPTLQGDKVLLKIRRFNQQQDNANSQNINGQQVDTTMLIPPNTWVKIGATQQNNVEQPTDQNTFSAGKKFANQATVYIKVTVGDTQTGG